MDIKKASVNYLGQGNNNLSKKRRARLLDTGSDRKTESEAEVFKLETLTCWEDNWKTKTFNT